MPDHSETAHPKIFVSYSHENDEHRSRTLGLAERLRNSGFDTMIDQYVEGTPLQGWPRWTLNQIEWADYVLLVCTETYYRRFRGHESPEVGKGVDWEGAIITNELYDKKSASRRFVPVLFDSGDSGYIPEPIRHFSFHVLSSEQAYGGLTDYLAGAAGIQPAALGPPPRRARATGTSIRFSDLDPTAANALPAPTIPGPSSFRAPGGAMRGDDRCYIERSADRNARAAAALLCETVVIKGPRQFGKSSLLARYLGICRDSGKAVASVSFAIFEQTTISDYSRFLITLAFELARCLKLAPPAGRLERQQGFNAYMETTLLPQMKGSVVLAFDDTDHIMRQGYAQDFFSMLRMWHDKRADPTCEFSKLGLALVTSSEPRLFIKDPLRSPFNVVAPLQLEPFTDAEAARLNLLYGAPLSDTECTTLCRLVAGHPFFLHEAFYRLCGPSPMSFKRLKMEAARANGPFGQHLRAMLSNLKSASLLHVMLQAINDGTIADDDFYRLEGAGLVRRKSSGRIVPANKVYAEFFRVAK